MRRYPDVRNGFHTFPSVPPVIVIAFVFDLGLTASFPFSERASPSLRRRPP